MGRRAAGLTAAKVRNAKAGRYGDGLGLYLFVKPSQAGAAAAAAAATRPLGRFWVWRFTPPGGGKLREMGLGPAGEGRGEVTLAEAREKLAALPGPEFGTMTAREFFLYQSQLSPKGSKYTKLARFALY